MIQTVLISGKQGSGKTTLANALQKEIQTQKTARVFQMTFAEPLYRMHDFCRGIVRSAGIEHLKGQKDGNLLQLLGTEWGRNTVNQNIWVEICKSRMGEILEKEGRGYDRVVFVISDCRFENEFDNFGSALRVRLECPKEIRKIRATMWRTNDKHPSETDLDHLDPDEWDMVFETSSLTPEAIASLIHAQLVKNVWTEKRIYPAL